MPLVVSSPPPPPPPRGGGKAEADRILGDTAELRAVLRAIAARVLGVPATHADVEDCVHETFRRALEGAERVDPERPVRPWILGIARHVAADRRRELRRNDPHSTLGGDPIEVQDARASDPFSRRHTEERVRRALEELPEGQGRALVLHHVEGRSYREIAAELAVPVGTVGTWLIRGRRALAAALDAEEEESP